MTKALVLLHCKAQNPESPAHHAHPAVGPRLQIKALTNPGIQLHACSSKEKAGCVGASRCSVGKACQSIGRSLCPVWVFAPGLLQVL